MLKKVISKSRRLAELKTDSARLLYTWLLAHLDVEGRFYANANIIKGAIVPRIRTMTLPKIETCLEDMVSHELIFIYEIDGDSYLQFRKFENHQYLRKDREARSIIPAPCNKLRSNSGVTPDKLRSNSGQTPAQYNISKDNIKKEKYKKERKDFYPDWLDMDLWLDFIKYRKTIKAPLTERAEKILLTELGKVINKKQGTQKNIIEQTIASGKWKGFYPVKTRYDPGYVPPHKPLEIPLEKERPSLEEIREARKELQRKGVKP